MQLQFKFIRNPVRTDFKMWKKKKCTCLLIFVLFSITGTFAANYGSRPSHQKTKKPVNGTIITTRFGEDGSVKEQCQCISFWLCDASKLYDDPNDPKPCGDPSLVCCKPPFINSEDLSGKPDSTYPSEGYQTCSEGVCVDSSECKNYGAGKLDFRGVYSCPETKVCCPSNDVIKKETPGYGTPPPKEGYTPWNVQPSSEPSGSESEKPGCVCVPPTHCANYGQGILQMRLSKCADKEICCLKDDIIAPPGPTGNPDLPLKPKYECGFKKGDPLLNRIANTDPNENTEFGEFPWMSLILKNTGNEIAVVCGASLLTADLLLTAAHCVEKHDKQSLIIRVGEHDTFLPPELEPAPHEDGYVADIYIPNNYRGDTGFNDLAIIKVKEPFKFRENVVPICSPITNPEYGNPDIYDPHRCLATGWGKDAYSKTAKLSKVLKKVDLMIVPKEECQNALRKTRLGSTFKLHDSFICAGGQPGKDTCKGDGGGPLICALKSDPSRYVQVGVTSWGIDCAKNYPGVYASVIYNKDWLQTEPNLHSIFEKRSTNGADQVFTISTDAEGKSSQTCTCVLYYLCDTHDVYYPSSDESHIKCGDKEACCKHPQFSDERQSTSNNNNTDICVAASQCDHHALADTYGLGELIERSVFSECPIGKIKCPADKVLPNVISTTTPVSIDPTTTENCDCTPPVYCDADFGENLLREKIFQCDSTEVCCPKDLVRPILPGSSTKVTPAPPSTNTTNVECGVKRDVLYPKIAGPSETIFGEFPWMVLILERVNNEEKVKCGGSLVSSNLVLTAAHCVQNKGMSSFIVRAGEYDLKKPSDSEDLPHQEREIINITIHTSFYRPLLLNDLALLEVNASFQYAWNVAPICLPLMKSPYSPEDTSIYDLTRCIATGWGSKDSGDQNVRTTLGKIDMRIIPSDECVTTLRKSSLGPKFFLHQSLICAIGKPGTDTCKGDGGGPLVCPLRSNPNKYVQVGVIAGGLPCNSPFPSLFASLLQNNSAWITEEIYFKNIFAL